MITNWKEKVNIKFINHVNLGRCYNEYNYKVVSKQALSEEDIKSIRDTGLIGYGQTWYCNNNAVVGQKDESGAEYFEYSVRDLVDSSD